MMRSMMWGAVPGVALLAARVAPPATTVTPQAATEVQASVGRTVDAAIDWLSSQSVAIATVDRVSGLIASQQVTVGEARTEYADCGKVMGVKIPPALVTYTVRVRGDSATATVHVTANWSAVDESESSRRTIACASTQVWENMAQAAVKRIAEGG